MASPVPAKSQPLHNFDLPRTLKWNNDGKSSSNHHQRRRSVKSPSRRCHPSPVSPLRHSPLRDSVSSTPPHRDSPLRDPVASQPFSREFPDCSVKSSPIRPDLSSKRARRSPIGGDSVNGSPVRRDSACHFQRRELVVTESKTSVKSKGVDIGYCRNQSKNPGIDVSRSREINSMKPERGTGKFEKKPRASEIDAAGTKRSSKILIKIPCKNNKSEEEIPNTLKEETPKEKPFKVEISDGGNHADKVHEEGNTENNNNSMDEEAKTWNLRPRKPLRKSLNVNGGGVTVKNNGSDRCKAQSPSKLLNNKSGENEGHGCGGGGGVEKEKRKLTINISLTKEEIEEDIFAFTGSKASRRPKKRPRNIQKQLDYVFPGLWLVSITPDSYKVSENSMKG